jgi:hypothetical protein
MTSFWGCASSRSAGLRASLRQSGRALRAALFGSAEALPFRNLFAVLLLASGCAAQQTSPPPAPPPDDTQLTAVPNRPTVTNTAETTQDGILEIEYGVSAASLQQNLNGLLKFGLFKDLELRIGANHWQHDATLHDAGVSDTQLGFKWRFLHQHKEGLQPTLSFQYTGQVPTADDRMTAAFAQHQFTFLASKDFGRHHIDFNTSYNLLGRPAGYDHTWEPTITYAFQLTPKWQLNAELWGLTRQNAATPAVVASLWGPSYSLRPWLVLDTAIQFGHAGNVPDVAFLAGFTYCLADTYRRHHR